MFQTRLPSIKKLAKKVTRRRVHDGHEKLHVKDQERLLRYNNNNSNNSNNNSNSSSNSNKNKLRRGFLAVYVGDERERFVVPTSCLSHPLFKILLAKACEEFGYEQKNGLLFPCSVMAFEEVVRVTKYCRGMFDLRHLVHEFVV